MAKRPPLESEGPPQRVGKAARKFKKEAEALTEGLSHLSDVAFERQLHYIVEELKGDRSLAFTLAPLLRDGTLSQILKLGKPSPGSLNKGKRLAPNCKKFKHLRPALEMKILGTLEPKLTETWFEETCPETLSPSALLTFALNVRGDSDLPRAWWPQCIMVEQFIHVCKLRYKAMGERLDAAAGMTPEQLQKFGYYQIAGQRMDCTLFAGVSIDLAIYSDTQLNIHNNCEHDAKLKLPKLKCTTDIKELFVDAGCKYPSEDEQWVLEGVEPVEMEELGASSGVSGSSAASSASATPSAATVTTPQKQSGSLRPKNSPINSLSDALMERLTGSGSVEAAPPPPK